MFELLYNKFASGMSIPSRLILCFRGRGNKNKRGGELVKSISKSSFAKKAFPGLSAGEAHTPFLSI